MKMNIVKVHGYARHTCGICVGSGGGLLECGGWKDEGVLPLAGLA